MKGGQRGTDNFSLERSPWQQCNQGIDVKERMKQIEEAIEIVQARNNISLKQKEVWGMMGIDMHANRKVELAELGS